ncbi:MAG: carboxysome shell protein [Cyanobacteria bacterium]|nr:carboxysome shell protein [Cyanobacteriota bacterium]
MASTTSREAALERRKALTNGGKKAEGRFQSAPVRVRSAADARATRTEPVAAAPANPSPANTAPAAVAAAPARARGRAASSATSRPAPDLSSRSAESRRSPARAIPNPSRDLVLARREALSRRGKRADNSRDRTRSEIARQQPAAATVVAVAPPLEAKAAAPSRSLSSSAARSRNQVGRNGNAATNTAANAAVERRATAKRSAQYNPSRALVLARREALSKRGKSATTPTSTTAAAVARQANPDLSSRELAQKVRELKSKVGSAGTARNGGSCRPCGPNRNGARLAAAAEASWKVGLTETSQGQTVTGTQANRSLATTGNEAGTCRTVTGTEYLGAEIFNTFCQSSPLGTQPPKVRVSATSQGNRVTGNEVGRSEKVTGDEPGTCKLVTGTEYVSANQDGAWCGTSTPGPRKVGQGLSAGGQKVSGVMVGRSELVTGNESGSGRQLSGDQYVGQQNQLPGKAPSKVSQLQTLRGTGVTGTAVGRSERVTGDEPGSCRLVTGDEYVGNQQYQAFCGISAPAEAAKVGFSITNRNQVVSGTSTGRSELVTGDEPGTCKAVTGTPYAGLEQAGGWCSTEQVDNVRRRTPVRLGTVMTGIQPGIGGVMTGADRGACEVISGTQYIGGDQTRAVCGAAKESDADFPQTLATQPWQEFSVQSPARVAQGERDRSGCVTGSTYEFGGRITGPFDMANDKVTGTEQFRFDRRGPAVPRNALAAGAARGAAASLAAAPAATAPAKVDPSARQTSRVTGAGQSSGLSISGDDWNRGKHVTGTEGASARRRNPTRPGPIAAMPAFQSKRNEELPEPVSRITGASGNTLAGSLITVSGGARG